MTAVSIESSESSLFEGKWIPLAQNDTLDTMVTSIVLLVNPPLFFIYGLEGVAKMGGKYWEMWYFAWEDGAIVFKPKKYAMFILPISGVLISVAAVVAIVEDFVHLRRGTYSVGNEIEAEH